MIGLHFPYKKEEKHFFSGELMGIWAHIDDAYSRSVFQNRVLYSMTDDFSFIRSIIHQTKTGERLEYLAAENRECYIYGAGLRGKRLRDIFSDVSWKGFVDRNKSGKQDDVPIYHPDDISAENSPIIVISNLKGVEEIQDDLINHGIKQENIISTIELDNRAAVSQYFEERCLEGVRKPTGGFVDLGAFDGRDSEHFLQWIGDGERSVFLIEPEKENYRRCVERIGGFGHARLFQTAVSDQNGVSWITNQGTISSIATDTHIEQKLQQINLVTLDDLLGEEQIGFIKMDIEGFEAEAIRGAAHIIREQHPILAVSVYHCREDIWKLPKMILDIRDDYILRFGHYSATINDTVMYGLPCI